MGSEVRQMKLEKTDLIQSENGFIEKIVSKDHDIFRGFGELYFNKVDGLKCSQWIQHLRYTSIIKVFHGSFTFEIECENDIRKVLMDDTTCSIMQIPPGFSFRFLNNLQQQSCFMNLLSGVHDVKEVVKRVK